MGVGVGEIKVLGRGFNGLVYLEPIDLESTRINWTTSLLHIFPRQFRRWCRWCHAGHLSCMWNSGRNAMFEKSNHDSDQMTAS